MACADVCMYANRLADVMNKNIYKHTLIMQMHYSKLILRQMCIYKEEIPHYLWYYGSYILSRELITCRNGIESPHQ